MKDQETVLDTKPKHAQPAFYRVDFTTALTPQGCRERLERADSRVGGVGGLLAPIAQGIAFEDERTFTLERRFPLALQPIRLKGHLDPTDKGGGTWVHGAITHDTYNQVLIEGLVVFLLVFLLTALFYLRLRARALVISGPLLALLLLMLSLRWQALRRATEDVGRWLRRRLYVTPEQVRPGRVEQ